jgi:DNA-binding transcriptional regulator LsrR (DeoR family)
LYPELIQQLCEAYPNLRDVVVVPEADDGEPLYRALVEGALAWLQPRLRPGLRIGLGMGRTVSYLPRNFQLNGKVDCTFIEIIGGAADQNAGISTYNVTAKMAELVGGRPEYLNTPTIVSSPAVRQSLLQENTVAAAFERARQYDIALQSVGPVDRSALLHVHSYLTEADLKALKARGAVGDVLGCYLDADGQPVPGPLDGRVMGLTLDEIKRLPLSVLVAGGPAKAPIMRAALRAQLFNILITDACTAAALLKLK